MREMRYLWGLPHTLSGEKLARVLPDFRATPLHEVLRRSLPADSRSTAGAAAPLASVAGAPEFPDSRVG
jgi:hypothetical protein